MKLNELKDKNLLILGFGREGIDTFRFLRKVFPEKVFGVGDRDRNAKCKMQNAKLCKKVRWHLGENYLKAIDNYDIIIKSPGIPIHLPEVERAFKEGKITSQTEIFFENCPGKIIGVTGTKGKSTTATLIYKILKKGGLRVHLVGNIGKPVLQLLLSATAKDVYVYELSSHQLYNLKKSPSIAVFLNIYPEHGDYYRNFNEYVKAKANITKYQNEKDFLIYNANDKLVRGVAEKSRAQKNPFGKCLIWKIKQGGLIGEANLQNIAAAIEVGKIFKISKEEIKKALKKFRTLPHRLELVGKFKGIKFYNDSLATVPESTIAAIDALSDDLETIILGGFERGQDFKNLAKKILESKIKTLILFPVTGERIWQSIRQAQDKAFQQKHPVVSHIEPFFVDTMKEAVKLAYQNTKKGKICLLSPASASFNLFKDYQERGNLFKKFVKLFAWAHSHTRA